MYGQSCHLSGPQFPSSAGDGVTAHLPISDIILLTCTQLYLRVTPPAPHFPSTPVCPLEIRPLNKRGISWEWKLYLPREGGACSLTKGHCFTLQCAHRHLSLAGVSRSHLFSAGPSRGFREQVSAYEPVSLGPQVPERGRRGGRLWQCLAALCSLGQVV